MRSKLLGLSLATFTVFAFSAGSIYSQTTVTFDNLNETGTGSFIPNGYEGLVWSNSRCINAILLTSFPNVGTSGYYFGMVSASNVVYNPFGGSMEIDSATNFNFLSAYLTGAASSNLNIDVQGFSGTNLVYDETKVASATNATLFTFNYLNIDRLYFDAYGGEDAGFPASGGEGGTWFAMDNFEFEFIPEPSSFLLVALGAVSLVALVRRKRLAALHQEVNLS
jgi:hypothetical protein